MALAMLLAGCGGGGGSGGVSSTPTPTPTPTPTNTSLTSLTVGQSFTNNSATHTAQFDRSSSNTISGSSAVAPLTIAYNPSGNTYTITTGGRTQSFASSDITSNEQGLAVFAKSDASGSDHLTLWASTFGGNGTRYVGRGMWQHNIFSDNVQNTTLDLFTYGFETPASAVPRTGTAAFTTDVFGLATKAGYQPRSFEGGGDFNVDFQTGVFIAGASVAETELVSGGGLSGGDIGVVLAGTLSASDGTFSGYAAYSGAYGKSQGTVTGRFYGPDASELGAVFTTSEPDGSSATGAILGAKTSDTASRNLTLTNFVTGETFGASSSYIELINTGEAASPGKGGSQLTRQVDGSFLFTGPSSEMAYGSMAASDQIAPSGANFTTYKKSLNGYTVTADLYKPGSENSELALTYTSFVHLNELQNSLNLADKYNVYNVYGVNTSPAIISVLKGKAHHSGVAYGTAIDTAGKTVYNVTGTSSFDADFSSSKLTGALSLAGHSGAKTQNYGMFDFATSIVNGFPTTAGLEKSGETWGTIAPSFFGPTAQEIGATFEFRVPVGQPGEGTAIAGAAVAKRP